MARNHSGQMALYEALNKERFNAAQKKELARVAQAKADKAVPVQPVTIAPQQPKNAEARQTVWTKKPGMFGLSNGRVEAYVPYPVAVTALMALALLLIIVFKVGHTLAKGNAATAQKGGSTEVVVSLADTAKAAKEMARMASPSAKRGSVTPAASVTTVSTGDEEPAVNSDAKVGDHVIVLAELKNASSSRDLEPAKQYFDEHGVATEIKNIRGSCFLVTKERFDGNFTKGTVGYTTVEKIRQLGAKYKAPAGYGGFGSKPFADAYGRKM